MYTCICLQQYRWTPNAMPRNLGVCFFPRHKDSLGFVQCFKQMNDRTQKAIKILTWTESDLNNVQKMTDGQRDGHCHYKSQSCCCNRAKRVLSFPEFYSHQTATSQVLSSNTTNSKLQDQGGPGVGGKREQKPKHKSMLLPILMMKKTRLYNFIQKVTDNNWFD